MINRKYRFIKIKHSFLADLGTIRYSRQSTLGPGEVGTTSHYAALCFHTAPLTPQHKDVKKKKKVIFIKDDKDQHFVVFPFGDVDEHMSESASRSVMSDSLWPHGLQPAGLLYPWDSSARILEWVAIPFSKGSSQPRDRTQVSCFAGIFLTI